MKTSQGQRFVSGHDSLEEREARFVRMFAMREKGLTLAQIAREFGLSRERVRQILRDGPLGPAGWAGHVEPSKQEAQDGDSRLEGLD
jgi:hypothetical protein